MPLKEDEVETAKKRQIVKKKENVMDLFIDHTYALSIPEVHRLLLRNKKMYPYITFIELETILLSLVLEEKLHQVTEDFFTKY